jgi:large subunit ribosomal protein L4
MPVVDVVNLEGKKVGELTLAEAVFGAKVNRHLLHEATRWYQAGLRAGTHKVKEKSEVSGAGRKLWRQKGTGRARVGSIRSPLWRKGGTVHGPRPRDYSYALPKKMVLGALRSALSAKLADQKLTIVEGFQLDTHKTQALRATLDKLKVERTALLVSHGENRNLELASRNLEGVKLVAPNVLQPYDLLRHDLLVLSKDAVARLSHTLDPESAPVEAPHVQSIAPAAKPATAGKPVKKEAAPKTAAPKSEAKSAKPAAAKKATAKKSKGKE